MTEAPHPKDAALLLHVDAPEGEIARAAARGRLHHAWLLAGPRGVGKAAFAYRVARWLLGAEGEGGPLKTRADDPVSRLVLQDAHPDLMVLERSAERRQITVDDARRLPAFFAKSPARGGYRVALVDAVDDLNPNAANALLKTLEEPSSRGVLILISHAPGALLATVRSRCRRLAFAPWPEAALAAWLSEHHGHDEEAAGRLARLAGGSPGRALQMADGEGTQAAAADAVFAALAASDASALQAVADRFRGGEGATRFAALMERLTSRAAERALCTPLAEAARWAETSGRLDALRRRTDALNLDRADAFWSGVAALRACAPRAA